MGAEYFCKEMDKSTLPLLCVTLLFSSPIIREIFTVLFGKIVILSSRYIYYGAKNALLFVDKIGLQAAF